MSDEWRKIKEKFPETLILCRVDDRYFCYKEDATALAQIAGMEVQSEGSVAASFPRHQLSEYLPKIIRTGRRVAIISE